MTVKVIQIEVDIMYGIGSVMELSIFGVSFFFQNNHRFVCIGGDKNSPKN